MDNKYFIEIKRVIVIVFLFLVICESANAQCYIVASERHRQRMLQDWGVYVEERQGNFASYEECVAYLDREISFDPAQRNEHWCDCDKTDQTESIDPYEQNQSSLIVEDRETQLQKIRLYEQEKLKEKELANRKIVEEKKQDLLGKIKKNKSLDQLRTTSDLSKQGEESTNNNQVEVGRNESESSFSQGKIKLKGRTQNNTVPVSPPVPIKHQETLFSYIDRETKTVQTKLAKVQKEKIVLLEKKNQVQEKIAEQTLKIEKLKTEKLEVKEESRKEDIDSLLLFATQMLEESEDLNDKANQELEKNNKLVQENEALLNKYQETYSKSKEHPEQSEQLLKELQGDKK